MATNNNQVAATILAQTIVVANEAAASAAIAQAAAQQTADKAPLISPAFTGVPTAPTPTDMNNSTQLSTTSYLDRLRGQANGLATLDGSGLIPSSQLPSLALTTVYTVNSQAAMLALPADPGDLAVRTDISETFILTASPASVLGNWIQLLFASPVTSVAGLVGNILATDLTAALNVFTGDSGSGGLRGMVPAPAAGDAAAGKVLGAGGGFVTKADLASPAFSGIPTSPTAAADTNTGQIASTSFVLGQASSTNPVVNGTAAPGTSLRYARGDHIHPTDTSRAPLASPTFTGIPAAPTAAPGTNTTQLATTAYADAIAALKANIASPAFTGSPTAPTQSANDNSTNLATTAYADAIAALKANIASPTFTGTPAAPTPGSNVNTTQIPTAAWVNTYFATLASPTFTGTPLAPTATPGTNTTQIATTAYADAIAALKANIASPTFTGTPAAPTPGSNVNTTQIPTTAWVNTYYAPLASPTFTGTPAAPTASPGTNTTQLASTAFVTAAVSAATAGVSSFNSRTGAVVPASGDYTVGQVTGAAALASPTFTGTPLSTTAAVDTNTTQIATTSFVLAQAASANPIINGTAAPGTSTRYARGDHVHPTDTSRAPVPSTSAYPVGWNGLIYISGGSVANGSSVSGATVKGASFDPTGATVSAGAALTGTFTNISGATMSGSLGSMVRTA